ncbi:hypothetical protein ACNSTU_11210 [Aquisalimonas sp. APHAB1-3]|uniref:hypothetical protein n=1 Tax=Aquisalimonas sp. APHAB1-3 TaxID=3402080 RepID=UPI003AABF5FA
MMVSFQSIPEWPPLAWLAECERPGQRIHVSHGGGVETAESWFCEAVWPGEFSAGDIDRQDLLFGSGGRLRDGALTFVSSAATVDRLQLLETDARLLVSNSLACLLEAVGGEVEPVYSGYYRDFRSIVRGIRQYKPTLTTSAGEVRFVYHDNVVWDGAAWARVEKPKRDRRFSHFESYRDFLAETLRGLGANMASPRRIAYRFRPLGTVSTGYDSPAVAAIAREAGLSEVITFTHARGGDDDDGEAIARHLGLSVTRVPRGVWRSLDGAIVPHLASNAYGEEVPYAALARDLAGRVLFTGHTGDRAWGKDEDDLSADIPRGDPVGLSLTEARLWYGALHCPVPFMGIREVADLRAISVSPEMKAWDVPGEYSRPIPRRIAEEAGVPRELFGNTKRASAVVLWRRDETFLPAHEARKLRGWLEANDHRWSGKGLVSPLQRKRRERVLAGLMMLYRPVHSIACRIPGLKPYSSRIRRLDPQTRPDPLFDVLFPWAIGLAKQRYRGGIARHKLAAQASYREPTSGIPLIRARRW